MGNGETVEQILSRWRSDGVRYVRFELPDMHGTSRSKLVPIEHAVDYAARRAEHVRRRGVLDTRSDVVPGTLYNEEVAYARPAARARSGDGSDRPLGRGDRAVHLRLVSGTTASPLAAAAAPRLPAGRSTAAASSASSRSRASSPSSTCSTARRRSRLFEGYHIFNTVRNTYVPFDRASSSSELARRSASTIITANCEYAGSQWEINFTPGRRAGRPRRERSRSRTRSRSSRTSTATARRSCRSRSPAPPAPARTPTSSLLDARRRNVFGDRRGRATGSRPSAGSSSPASSGTRASIYALLVADGELHEAPADAHVQPDERVLGRRGPRRRSSASRAARRVTPRRAPRADGALEPVPRRPRRFSARACSGIEEGLELEPPARAAGRGGLVEAAAARRRCASRSRRSRATRRVVELLGEEFVSAYTTMRRYELQRFDDHVTDWERARVRRALLAAAPARRPGARAARRRRAGSARARRPGRRRSRRRRCRRS